jgi:hypothetical protein
VKQEMKYQYHGKGRRGEKTARPRLKAARDALPPGCGNKKGP